MLLQFNSNFNDEQARAMLIRDDYKEEFRYKTINPRKFIFNDPMEGFKMVTANTSIKTHANIDFVMGDKILLEEMDHPLVVVNITQKKDERQYMHLKKSTVVEYTLDLA